MVFPKARLVVSAALFLAWIAFLAYLVAVTRHPIILSRPQILVSDLCVLADVDEQDSQQTSEVHVVEVLWASDNDKSLEGQLLVLSDLADLGQAQGWAGKGRYLLPLTKRKLEKQSTYELTPMPLMPGFQATVTAELADAGPNLDQVAGYLQRALAIDAERAKRMVQRPGVLKRFLAAEAAINLKRGLEQLGARVQLEEYETRIYRATEDALRQFHELK